jgi:hypothetical protein
LVLLRLLADTEALRAQQIQYLVWVDADAVVVRSEPLSSLVRWGAGKDVIIAEDCNPGE